jgi:hypothetical protein
MGRAGQVLVSAALVAGALGVLGPGVAHAFTPVKLYVAAAVDGGSDAHNNCTLPAKPCATIGYALAEEAQLSPDTVGSVIDLAKGTYDAPACTVPPAPPLPGSPAGCDSMFAGLAPANSDVTITGTGKKTFVDPTTCGSLATVTSGQDAGDKAMVAFQNGEDGISVENLVLNASAVTPCAGYDAGVIITDWTNADAVVGDTIESGATYGVLTDDWSDSTIISNTLSSVLCAAKVAGPNTGLNAGWTTPANLKVSGIPKCAQVVESGHGAATGFSIDGTAYCISFSGTDKTFVITGTPDPTTDCTTGGDPITNSAGPAIAKGAQVIYNTSTSPFTQWGIACNTPLSGEDQSTDCAVSDNTVVGGGTIYGDLADATSSLTPSGQVCDGLPPVGILATGGATADIDGNSVSDIADEISECPETGESTDDGVGIALLPDAVDGCSAGNSVVGVNDIPNPTTGHGNKLGSTSANGTGIVVSGNTGAWCSTADPTYQVNANTVTAASNAGIVLTNLGYGNGTLGAPMQSNSVTGVLTGPGIALQGVAGQSIGGILASQGNAATGDGVGLVLAPCLPSPVNPPGCATYAGAPVSGGGEPSDANLVQNNTFTGNVEYGVLAVGNAQPEEIAAPVGGCLSPGMASCGNTFDANTWGSATSATNGTNPTAIDGAEVMDGTGWGGGCGSETGDCPTGGGAGPLVFEGPDTTFSATSPGAATFSLSVCNSGTSPESLPAGSQITFYGDQPGDGGTFYVTTDAIVTEDVAGTGGCGNPAGFFTLSLQAIAPADVGTTLSPTGQPYTLAAGDLVEVNINGGAEAPANFYGGGPAVNSCTPAGVTQAAGTGPAPLNVAHPALTTPNVFGMTDPPTTPFAYSTTLQASTGGVNATYSAC